MTPDDLKASSRAPSRTARSRPRPRASSAMRSTRRSTSSTRASCASPRRRRQLGRPSMAEEGGAAVVPPERVARSRAVPAARPGGTRCRRSSPAGRRTNSRRRASGPCRARRPPLGLHRAGRRADAVLRQSRRLCRRGHHGRYLGDGRLLRPDRQERAYLRRRRHRRRAGAACRPARRSSRTIASSAPAPRWPRASSSARARCSRWASISALDQDHRPRDRRSASGPRAALFGGRLGHLARQAAADGSPGPRSIAP